MFSIIIMIPTVSSHPWLFYWRGKSCFRCVSFASRLGPFSIEWYMIDIYIYSLLGEVSWVGWSELDETHLLGSKSISFGKDPYSSLLALLIPMILLHDKISSVIIVSSLSLTKSWVQLHGVGPSQQRFEHFLRSDLQQRRLNLLKTSRLDQAPN